MKTLIVRCEDKAIPGDKELPLLGSAKYQQLSQWAQSGIVGRIRPGKQSAGLDGIYRGLLGLKADNPLAKTGLWYAAAANINLGHNESAWCCDFVTEEDGSVVDASAGQIPSLESQELIQALEDHLGSDARHWQSGESYRNLLIVRDSALEFDPKTLFVPTSDVLGKSWKKQVPQNASGEALLRLMEQASKVLQEHPVNRVRIDLGENPATLAWLWGGAKATSKQTFVDRTGFSAALIGSGFLMRGCAQALGLTWKEVEAELTEEWITQRQQSAEELLKTHDLVYVPMVIRSQDPVQRLCYMERIDQQLFKPMAALLNKYSDMRVVVIIDNCQNRTSSFVIAGRNVSPSAESASAQLNQEDVTMEVSDSIELFPWITGNSIE